MWNPRAHSLGSRVSWRENRLANVILLWARLLPTTNVSKFHACETTIVLLFLSIGMSTNVNKEVLTSKRQGLSEVERARERERARDNRQRSTVVQVNGKEKRKEHGKRGVEVLEYSEKESKNAIDLRLKQGKLKFYCVAEPNRNKRTAWKLKLNLLSSNLSEI